MKTFVHVLLVAACFVAFARGLPRGIGYPDDSSEEDDNFGWGSSFDNFDMSNFFSDFFNKMRQHILNIWDPDMTNVKIPEGANTTSTTKIINGHVVTINETTYTSGDDTSGTAFRIRIIDVKPVNETVPTVGGNSEPPVRPEPDSDSRETVEEFNNEISKNTETLTA